MGAQSFSSLFVIVLRIHSPSLVTNKQKTNKQFNNKDEALADFFLNYFKQSMSKHATLSTTPLERLRSWGAE